MLGAIQPPWYLYIVNVSTGELGGACLQLPKVIRSFMVPTDNYRRERSDLFSGIVSISTSMDVCIEWLSMEDNYAYLLVKSP